MIDEIQVENLALIRRAVLEPSSGLTVLTGETGAGKSALLSAFKLLMGARADKDQVREGTRALTVSGRFFGLRRPGDAGADGEEGSEPAGSHHAGAPSGDAPEGAQAKGGGAAGAKPAPAADDVAGADEDGIVVTRRVSAEGRSRATIDGSMASARELAALVSPSVDLCGQFEHQQLMRPAAHAGMLDAWAHDSIAPALSAYQQAFSEARRAQRELDRVRAAKETSDSRLDEARFTLRRIDEVNPQQGEYEQLTADLQRAEHAEALVSGTSCAHEALAGEGGAIDSLETAASALEDLGPYDDSLDALAQSLREAGYVLEDVAAEARDYRDKVDFDPESLAQQQERASLLQGLLHAFGPRMEDVFAARDEAAEEVSLVDDAAQREEAATRALVQAEERLAAAADALDAARTAAAPPFSEQVSATMDRLQMNGAQLVCSIERLPRASWTKAGPSAVEFLYRPSSGMQARPLARIASGGEVSRVMLAIKVALGAVDNVDTLVFDEVDAGVGGAVANALAGVLADLARTHQVIVVTHLAQVAVRADVHYRVGRTTDKEGACTQLKRLNDDERVVEVARMLSGDATDASLAHAREMLDRAQSDVTNS